MSLDSQSRTSILGPNTFLIGTDGGLYKTETDGFVWQKIEQNKTNEFYRVEHTPFHPDQFYGGMQDNGTSGGNASMSTWPRMYGGDGFQIRYSINDPDMLYAETQNGNIVYSYNGGLFFQDLSFPDYNNRTNWDTPYVLSAYSPAVVYAGSHRVWMNDQAPGNNWELISDDLTDGNIYGSSFHTISGLDESPISPRRLYACTSDGNVWR